MIPKETTSVPATMEKVRGRLERWRRLDRAGPHDGTGAPRRDQTADSSDQRGAGLSARARLSRAPDRGL